MANPRSYKKKNRLDRVLINSLIVVAAVVLFSGPIRELYVLTLKALSSINKSISSKTNFKFEQIVNSSEVIERQTEEIALLKKELDLCKRELKSASITAKRVEITEALLNLKRSEFPKSVSASVIARSPSSWHQELIIDKGSSSQISPGMVAVTERGILGQVQEVRKGYSIVQLVSSSQIRFGAMIQRSGVVGVLFGNKAGYAQLKFVPIGSDVKKGDIIQTTSISPNGIERLFPVAYPVGKVIEVSKDESNSEMFIRVKLFEDGSRISDVLILLPSGNKLSAWHLNPARLETLLARVIKEEAALKSIESPTNKPTEVVSNNPEAVSSTALKLNQAQLTEPTNAANSSNPKPVPINKPVSPPPPPLQAPPKATAPPPKVIPPKKTEPIVNNPAGEADE